MKPVHLPGHGMTIGYAELAALRHGMLRDLDAARRNHETIPDDLVATIQLADELGAAWEVRQRVAKVAREPENLDSPRCAEFESMTVTETAKQWGVSESAVKARLARRTLHGVKGPKTWRVCAIDARARKEGTRCQH